MVLIHRKLSAAQTFHASPRVALESHIEVYDIPKGIYIVTRKMKLLANCCNNLQLSEYIPMVRVYVSQLSLNMLRKSPSCAVD